MNNSLSAMVVLPEIVMAVFAMSLLIAGAVCGRRVTRQAGWLAILGLFVTAVVMLCPQRLSFMLNGNQPVYAFYQMFIDDGFARFVKLILLLASAFSIMLSWSYMEKEKLDQPEYPVLVLFAALGMMLMVSASNLLALYVGLELQSLTLYVMAAFQRDQVKSSEAGLKYFVLGALSSGLMLYGISLIYGYTGTIDFASIASSLRDVTPPPIGVIFGVVFICAALAFKVSAVPFHMWTPDVYEGAPTPVTAFFAAAPKVAALALFMRLLFQPFSVLLHQWDQIVVFCAVASMLLGSFTGLVQTNIKRLMAYSSIANVGYALVGLAAVSKSGVQAVLIYLAIYFMNTLGIFGVILCLRRQGKMAEQISDLSGLAKTNPLLASAMAVFMFSIAGLPPLAGFFGKYFIFLAAIKAGMISVAVIGVLSSVVALVYYLRLVKVMYFDEPLQAIDPLTGYGARVVLALTALYVLFFCLWPAPVIDGAAFATRSFLGG